MKKKEVERIYTENLGLLYSTCAEMYKRYYEQCKAQLIDLDDFNQIGSIGFLKAIERFDESKGFKLSTYAVAMIRGEIMKFMRDKASLIKVPRIDYAKDEEDKISISAINFRDSVSLFSTIISDNEDFTLENILGSDNNLHGIEDRIIIYEAMEVLDDLEKTCIIETFFNDKYQKEVGEMVGFTQVHVSRTTKRAIQKMREAMITMRLEEVI